MNHDTLLFQVYLVEVPAMIVAEAENTWVPVVSLRAAVKVVPAWRSTFQVKLVAFV